MKSLKNLWPMLILALVISVSSCNKEDDTPDETPSGEFSVNFNYVWGPAQLPFSLNEELTHPRTSEKLTFSAFRFYVSNIKLQKDDGTWWIHPESYFIVDAFSVSRSTFAIDNVPTGNYVAMEYTLGVDSVRNVSGAQTGALSPANGMFWSWNTGYIMVLAEGNEADEGMFAYHLGGFSGSNNIVTVKTADFGEGSLLVAEGSNPTVKMVCNPARLWHTIDGIAEVSSIMSPGSDAVTAATDFYGTFSFLEIED
jgi:hypothetical protein